MSDASYARRWFNAPGETPAEQMGRLLAKHRRAGLSFWQAWPLSMAAIRFTSRREQDNWLAAWQDVTVFAAWTAAYERRPHFGTQSVAALAGVADAVGFSEGQAAEPVAWVHGTAMR